MIRDRLSRWRWGGLLGFSRIGFRGASRVAMPLLILSREVQGLFDLRKSFETCFGCGLDAFGLDLILVKLLALLG